MNVQKLIEDNLNLVYFVIHKHYPTFCQDEDIIQTGMVGLCDAANTWNEEKSSFSTYAVICIRNAINLEFRNRKKHNGVLSLDHEYSDSEEDTGTLADFIVGDEDVCFTDTEQIRKVLSPNLREIFDLRKDGWTDIEIAKKLGVSRSTVHKKVKEIRQIWRKIYGN